MTILSQAERRELWGGAVTCVLPTRLVDVSDMRPVPDHQEVFADTQTDQAIILEIVEHDDVVSDEQCGAHMFEDAAAGNEATTSSMESVSSLDPSAVPLLPEASFRCLVRGRQTLRRGQEPTDVAVLLAALRLPHVHSDLLISLSTPVSQAGLAAEAEQVMAQALSSLRVLDWGLFGGG